MDSFSLSILSTSRRTEPRLSRQVRGRPQARLLQPPTGVPWKTEATGCPQGLCRIPPAIVPSSMGGLLQTTLRRSRTCSEVPGQLHPSHRHLQPPPDLFRPRPSHLSLARLRPWQQKKTPDNLAYGVLASLPAPRTPAPLCPHSPPRLPRQPTTRIRAAPLLRLVDDRISTGPDCRSQLFASRILDLPSLRRHDGRYRTPHICPALLALSAATNGRQSIMTNLFTARTNSVFQHAQASCASDRETPPLSRVFPSNPTRLSAHPSRSHTPSAHACFTKTSRLLPACV